MTRLRSSLWGVLFGVACVAYAASAQAQCEITGRTVICPDATVQLCAPTSPDYMWVDEEGNVLSRAQCITAVLPGTYRAYTYDAGLDVWWGPCVHVVSTAPAESCMATPPPPPPPPPAPELDTLACPRPASWWAKQCRREHGRRAELSAADLAAIGAQVDERSQLFAWGEPGSGLCRTLGQKENTDLRRRTLRQYAAVLANLSARHAGATQRGGNVFGLGADAGFSTFFGATTVGAWVNAADAELVQLDGASLKDKGVRAAYRRIFGEAWAIGHGVGLDMDCPMPPAGEDDEDSSVLAALGEESELEADLGAPLAPVAMPNPFHGSTRFAFTVPDASGADVDLSVFDVAGRRMATLARGHLGAGQHVVQWDGRGLDGSRARAGMYFVRGSIGQAQVTTSVLKVE
jgi:hypothetical protein